MVYKRHIIRHGKKMGPYYYENVRGKDGKVKSVYIGRQNPKKEKLNKKIILFLIMGFLIIIPSYFFFESRINVESEEKQNLQEIFDIDQIMIKTLLKTKESAISPIRVMNIGSEDAFIYMELKGLEDLISFSETKFIIKPGQTKIVYLNFSASIKKKNIEYAPDIYVGKLIVKSGEYKKELPIIVEIESTNVLFDMNINVPPEDREIKQGGNAVVEVRLFNLQGTSPVNIEMYYFVKDLNGNIIITESETVVVATQASFFKTIKIPDNLKEGEYIFAAKAEYASSSGTASYLFDIIKQTEPKKKVEFFKICKGNALCWIGVFAALIMIFSIGAYVYFLVGAWFFSKFYGKSRIESKDGTSKKAETPSQKIAKEYKRVVLWLILILLTILIIKGFYSYLKEEGIMLIKNQILRISYSYGRHLTIAIILISSAYYAYRKKENISESFRKWKIKSEKKEEERIKIKENEEIRREKEKRSIEKEKRKIIAERKKLKEIKKENKRQEKRKRKQRKRREKIKKQEEKEKRVKEKKHRRIINNLLLILNKNIKIIERYKWILEKDDEDLIKTKEKEFKKIELQLKSDEECTSGMGELKQRIDECKRYIKTHKLRRLEEERELQLKYNEYSSKTKIIREGILKRISYIRKFERKLRKKEEKRKIEKKQRLIERKREEEKERALLKRIEEKKKLKKKEEKKKEERQRKRKKRKRIEEKNRLRKEKLKEKERLKSLKKKENYKKKGNIKKKTKEFFHKLGFYKTKSEKRIIRSIKEKRVAEEKKKKAAEMARIEEEKRKINDLKEREKEERAKIRKAKLRGFFHKLGVYKTKKEKQEIKRRKKLKREKEERDKKRIEAEKEKQRIDEEKEKLRKLKERDKKRIEAEKEKQRIDEEKGGFFQKIGLFKSKETIREKEQKQRTHKKLKNIEELPKEEEEGKGNLKESINEFNDILKEIDKKIKDKKIKEAAALYITLNQMYGLVIKNNIIGKVGEKIVYSKINEAYNKIRNARKQQI